MILALLTGCLQILLGIVLLLLATIVFDIIHVTLHRMASSPQPFWRRIGNLHGVHHQFLDTSLHIHDDKQFANVFHHVIPEFIVQLLVTAALMPLFPTLSALVAFAIETGAFIFIMWGRPGIDVNHKPVDQLQAYQPLYFCVPEYHLLHHVYPDAFFSSWIKTLDHLLGTGICLHNRRVLVTGTATPSPLVAAFMRELAAAGCQLMTTDGTQDPAAPDLATPLRDADILLLCHDITGASYPRWIETFHAAHQQDRIPVEVWALVQAEAGDAGFRRYARELFSAQKVIYRHLVVDNATDSELAAGLLRHVRRGFNFVPARFSWRALAAYWQFVRK